MEAQISNLEQELNSLRLGFESQEAKAGRFNLLQEGLSKAEENEAEMRKKFEACSAILMLPDLTHSF